MRLLVSGGVIVPDPQRAPQKQLETPPVQQPQAPEGVPLGDGRPPAAAASCAEAHAEAAALDDPPPAAPQQTAR